MLKIDEKTCGKLAQKCPFSWHSGTGQTSVGGAEKIKTNTLQVVEKVCLIALAVGGATRTLAAHEKREKRCKKRYTGGSGKISSALQATVFRKPKFGRVFRKEEVTDLCLRTTSVAAEVAGGGAAAARKTTKS